MDPVISRSFWKVDTSLIDGRIKTDNYGVKYVLWMNKDSTPLLFRIGSVALLILATVATNALLTGFPVLIPIALFSIVLLGVFVESELVYKKREAYAQEYLIRAIGGQNKFDNLQTFKLTNNIYHSTYIDASMNSHDSSNVEASWRIDAPELLKIKDPITKIVDPQGRIGFCLRVKERGRLEEPPVLLITYPKMSQRQGEPLYFDYLVANENFKNHKTDTTFPETLKAIIDDKHWWFTPPQ